MKLQSRPQRRKALPHRNFAACLKACPDTNLPQYKQSGILSGAEVPASHQLLRSSISAGGRQFAEIIGTIDIPRNSWEFEDNTRQARCLGRGQVRQEAVVPEAKRKQVT